MGKLVSIPDETKELIDRVMAEIKGEYITQSLFLDSAIRARLRGMGIQAGEDLIIAHLQRLEESKQRHLEAQSIAQTRLRHKRRVATAEKKLSGEL